MFHTIGVQLVFFCYQIAAFIWSVTRQLSTGNSGTQLFSLLCCMVLNISCLLINLWSLVVGFVWYKFPFCRYFFANLLFYPIDVASYNKYYFCVFLQKKNHSHNNNLRKIHIFIPKKPLEIEELGFIF